MTVSKAAEMDGGFLPGDALKKIDGVLAVGRSASCRPNTLLRGRIVIMQMGRSGELLRH